MKVYINFFIQIVLHTFVNDKNKNCCSTLRWEKS
jgi:hypothetical protein